MRYFLYVPATLSPALTPPRVLLALHGIGDNGPNFARAFLPAAQDHGWIVVAPTFNYGDWRNPAQVRAEDVRLDRQLTALLDGLLWQGYHLGKRRVLIAGFSRGAQVADRFALFNPERVMAVASLSAGTYTVPEASADVDGDGQADELPLPYGTADMPDWVGHALDTGKLRSVEFYLGVGGDDTNPNDLPRQWDKLLGGTRVDRARAFQRSLAQLDIPAQLTIFPGAKHQLTPSMTRAVDAFLERF